MRTKAVLASTIVVLALLAVVGVGSAHAAVYPSPPPDFSHPGRVHYNDPFFSPLGGQADRPILVLYVRWDDIDYPAAFPADVVSRRFFGTGFPSTTFPSVGDYYRRLSFNDMFLFPAPETQGATNDGVVQVQYPGTKASFLATSFGTRNKKLLELANPFVDFEALDLDSDGKLTDEELVVNAYEAAPETPMWKGCGVQSGTDGVSLDGTALGSLRVAMTNTSTNLITIIHENAHVALGMKDLYGFDVGGLDIGASTCEPDGVPPNDGSLFAPNAWHKLHWGWITPTVVTQDGFYDVRRADTTGDAFILYDPDRGTDDYFIAENRTRTPGTYDQSASGKGLVIWRVADDRFGVADDPIGLMRQPGTSRAGSDAAVSPTAERTMSQPWIDGTDSKVAVRAIGAAGDVMRAYFDVRGPGILVDTYPVDRAGPVQLTAGRANIVDVPVTNTGEACDTFLFQAVSMPIGWTMEQSARILCAGETSFARLIVTPDANAALGARTITISGFSLTIPGVATDSPLRVEAVLTPSKFDLSGLANGAPTGSLASFPVRLTSATAFPQPLAGVPVTFTLAGAGGTLTTQTTTSAAGFATASFLLTLPPGSYSLTIESERSGAFAPSSTTVPYEVFSLEAAIESAVDDLDALIAATADAGARQALQAARDDLVGNSGGTSTNGALDKVDDDPAGAITKLRSALSNLLTAEARGASGLAALKRLLGLTAEAIATEEYERAKSNVGTPSPGEAQALARIAAGIETGREHLQANRYLDACDSFRQATMRALNLSQ